ncbi:single strand DNA binding protein [Lactobacillus phage LL-Ku]|uniref:Single-stranded DNA-binding protein n=1 Tax=Lactobacillus phage LL-Ku TaxID=2892343 RepID=F7V9C8_9CAUD|nr:single strand DNA binding protein [Lactobacillus phage LL-Ku]AAV30189.1 putative single-stranded DNA binding protein [Lactobacillus phage LL-Ku]
MSINSVVLTGRLTKDVDLRVTNSGKNVARFTLAVDRNYKSDQQADFLTVSVWGKQAENTATYCHKGSLVGVQGHLRSGSYDKNGQKVYFVDVEADSVQFLDTRNKTQDASQNSNLGAQSDFSYQSGQTYQSGSDGSQNSFNSFGGSSQNDYPF